MNLTIEIQDTATGFLDSVAAEFEGGDLKRRIQGGMAMAFHDTVVHNFGDTGEDRPVEWRFLSPKYAEEFHGGDLTPREILAGDMMESVLVDSDSVDAASVYTNCPYAEEQQNGNSEINLPPRPFFPMNKAGQLTPGVIEKCLLVAEVEFYEFFGSNPF